MDLQEKMDKYLVEYDEVIVVREKGQLNTRVGMDCVYYPIWSKK